MKCFKGKKSTTYCHLLKSHKEKKTSSCADCLKTGTSVSHCRIIYGNTTVTNLPSIIENSSSEVQPAECPNCASNLSSLKIHMQSSVVLDIWILILKNHETLG